MTLRGVYDARHRRRGAPWSFLGDDDADRPREGIWRVGHRLRRQRHSTRQPTAVVGFGGAGIPIPHPRAGDIEYSLADRWNAAMANDDFALHMLLFFYDFYEKGWCFDDGRGWANTAARCADFAAAHLACAQYEGKAIRNMPAFDTIAAMRQIHVSAGRVCFASSSTHEQNAADR